MCRDDFAESLVLNMKAVTVTYDGRKKAHVKFLECEVDAYQQWCREKLVEFLSDSPYDLRQADHLDHKKVSAVSWTGYNNYNEKFHQIAHQLAGDLRLLEKYQSQHKKLKQLAETICGCPIKDSEENAFRRRTHQLCHQYCPNQKADELEEYEALAAYVKILENRYEESTLKYRLQK